MILRPSPSWLDSSTHALVCQFSPATSARGKRIISSRLELLAKPTTSGGRAQGDVYHRLVQAPGISKVSQKVCHKDTLGFCFVLFKTSLLRLNLDSIKSIHFKCKCWNLQPSPQFNFRTLSSPQKCSLCPFAIHLFPHPSPSLCLYSFAFSRIAT